MYISGESMADVCVWSSLMARPAGAGTVPLAGEEGAAVEMVGAEGDPGADQGSVDNPCDLSSQ